MGDATETSDDPPLNVLDTGAPSDETGDSDDEETDDGGDIGVGDGDGDPDESETETGESDTDEPSICGDGIVSSDEECDTAMAAPLPCGNNQVGSFVCNADCTKNEAFCDCELGTEGCLCDELSVCESGLNCINDGLPVCEAACLPVALPCSALDVCCAGTCQPAEGGDVSYCM
jgi:hypothetical protein